MPLTLSRKEQESVVVFTNSNEEIEITITKIDSNQVRLSFDGPDSVDIWRSELLKIQGDED
jgi:carbon storage regulator CsrA